MAFDNERYEIRILQNDDVDEVAKLFASTYREREPIFSTLPMSEDEIYEKIGKDWVVGCAEEQLSLVCVDKTEVAGNQIVGFRLTRTLDLNSIRENKVDYSIDFKAELACGVLMSECKEKWLELHPELNNDQSNNDEKHLIFLGLAVKKGYENQLIGTKLVEVSVEDAKMKGFKYGIVLCSAARSQHIFEEKFKFKRVFSRRFKDVEYNGHRYLQNVIEPPAMVLYEIDFTNVQ